MAKKNKKSSKKNSDLGVSDQSSAELSQKETQKQASRAYAGAQTSNLTADWRAASTSADSEIVGALRPLRNRSRQMIRDNNEFKAAVRSWANNVVGTGTRLQSKVRRRRGDGYDKEKNKEIESLWETCGKAHFWHVGGAFSRPDSEALMIKALVGDGEIFVRMITRQYFGGSPVPFSIEIIEADQLCDDRSYVKYGENEVRMGVEFDQWQRPVAYHFYPYHPGDLQFGQRRNKGSQLIRVPAEEIIHLFIRDRPGQTRGVPWFHSALVTMRHLAGGTEAEVIKMRGQANITAFIRTPDPDSFVDSVSPGSKANKPDADSPMTLRPGVVPRLAPGEEIQSFIPTSPGGNFEPFIWTMMRSAAIAIGLSYSTFTGDYSKTTFSSIRAEKLDERDCFKVIQSWFVAALYDRLFPVWLDMAVLSGALNLPNYELNPAFYCKPRFMCRGWSWVNPLQDVKASEAAVMGGFSTLTQVAAENGLDIEELLEERQKELELAKKLGLNFDTTVEPPVVPAQPTGDQADQSTGDQGQRKSFGFWTTSSAESRSLEVCENPNTQTSADLEDDDPEEEAIAAVEVMEVISPDDDPEEVIEPNAQSSADLKQDDPEEEAIAEEEVMEVEAPDPEEVIEPNPQTSADLEQDDLEEDAIANEEVMEVEEDPDEEIEK
jgi:lambda family phage portal protein